MHAAEIITDLGDWFRIRHDNARGVTRGDTLPLRHTRAPLPACEASDRAGCRARRADETNGKTRNPSGGTA
jgi:hypothetical protein